MLAGSRNGMALTRQLCQVMAQRGIANHVPQTGMRARPTLQSRASRIMAPDQNMENSRCTVAHDDVYTGRHAQCM